MTILRVPETWSVLELPRRLHGPNPCLLQESLSHGGAGSGTQDSCSKPGVLIAVCKVCPESGILQFLEAKQIHLNSRWA